MPNPVLPPIVLPVLTDDRVKKIKTHFDQIYQAIEAENLTLAIFASMEFGEYLYNQFDAGPEEHIKWIKPLASEYSEKPIPTMLVSTAINEAKAALTMANSETSDYNVISTLTHIASGINCFNSLLGDDRCGDVLEGIPKTILYKQLDQLQPIAEKFISEDLIPNKPARMQMNNAINGIVSFADTQERDNKLILQNLAKNLKEESTKYYADSNKTESKTKKYQKICKIQFEASESKLVESLPEHWKVVRDNTLLAIAAITTFGFALGIRAAYTKYKTGEVSILFKDILPENVKATKDKLVDVKATIAGTKGTDAGLETDTGQANKDTVQLKR